MTHGWFGAKCPCDPYQQQQTKHYKTISTSTQPTPSNKIACSNCAVPRRTSPPANLSRFYGTSGKHNPGNRSPPPAYSVTCRPLSNGSPPPAYRPPSTGTPPGMKSSGSFPSPKNGNSPPCGVATVSTGVGTCVSIAIDGSTVTEAMSRAIVPSASVDLIDLRSDDTDQYATFNPCYKSTTPPEDVVPYPILTQPMPLLEGAPASMPSLQEFAPKPEILPPRSLTAPNVRGLDDLSESGLWQPRGRSPRSSWAGPATSNSSTHYVSQQGPWPIYDEVYIPPRGVSPEPPIRTASLPQAAQSHNQTKPKKGDIEKGACAAGATATSRSMSQIPRLEMLTQTTRIGLHQRSVSQQTVAGANAGNSYALSPSIKVDCGTSTPTSGTEVWVPQIQHKQSQSFEGLTAKEEQKHNSRSRNRLTQSCEHLQAAQSRGGNGPKRTKRRCPTPPRVLSPSLESVKCEVIADI